MRKLLRMISPAILGLAWLVIGTPSSLRAQATAVPEIDPTNALTVSVIGTSPPIARMTLL
jgi:hypothetical protein